MDECLGLLVTHADGHVECLDDQCLEPDAPRHEWRAACEDVPEVCGCHDRRAQAQPRRAA